MGAWPNCRASMQIRMPSARNQPVFLRYLRSCKDRNNFTSALAAEVMGVNSQASGELACFSSGLIYCRLLCLRREIQLAGVGLLEQPFNLPVSIKTDALCCRHTGQSRHSHNIPANHHNKSCPSRKAHFTHRHNMANWRATQARVC